MVWVQVAGEILKLFLRQHVISEFDSYAIPHVTKVLSKDVEESLSHYCHNNDTELLCVLEDIDRHTHVYALFWRCNFLMLGILGK